MKLLSLTLLLALATPALSQRPWLSADDQYRFSHLWPDGVKAPEGFRFYQPTKTTQYMAVRNDVHICEPWPTDKDYKFANGSAENPNRKFPYRVPGGLDAIPQQEWYSLVGVSIPAGKNVVVWKERTPVSNAPQGWLPKKRRAFPDGTVFADFLLNKDGKLFELRTREKVAGEWKSEVAFRNADKRPPNYKGHGSSGKSCAACHDHAEASAYFINTRRDDGNFTAGCFVEGTLTWDTANWPLEIFRGGEYATAKDLRES